MNMILSVEEALQACADLEALEEMGLMSSAEVVVSQAEIMARTVPVIVGKEG